MVLKPKETYLLQWFQHPCWLMIIDDYTTQYYIYMYWGL